MGLAPRPGLVAAVNGRGRWLALAGSMALATVLLGWIGDSVGIAAAIVCIVALYKARP